MGLIVIAAVALLVSVPMMQHRQTCAQRCHGCGKCRWKDMEEAEKKRLR
ncbi:MAG: hypothetical protein KBH12_05760 [Synergistaceae bacterium]|nr:hypothetical protein [Synergistaceae bacterium]MBP9627133.1 hypothetical protein [Synergistaceae bacterium]